MCAISTKIIGRKQTNKHTWLQWVLRLWLVASVMVDGAVGIIGEVIPVNS